jgi:hypothetical protein
MSVFIGREVLRAVMTLNFFKRHNNKYTLKTNRDIVFTFDGERFNPDPQDMYGKFSDDAYLEIVEEESRLTESTWKRHMSEMAG